MSAILILLLMLDFVVVVRTSSSAQWNVASVFIDRTNDRVPLFQFDFVFIMVMQRPVWSTQPMADCREATGPTDACDVYKYWPHPLTRHKTTLRSQPQPRHMARRCESSPCHAGNRVSLVGSECRLISFRWYLWANWIVWRLVFHIKLVFRSD